MWVLSIIVSILFVLNFFSDKFFVTRAEFTQHTEWAAGRNEVLIEVKKISEESRDSIKLLLWEFRQLRKELKHR